MCLRLSAQAIREVQALADSPVVLRKQAPLPLCKADKWITTIDGELQWTISRQPQQGAAVTLKRRDQNLARDGQPALVAFKVGAKDERAAEVRAIGILKTPANSQPSGFESVPIPGICDIVSELQVLAQRIAEQFVLIATGSERVKHGNGGLCVKSC